MFGKSRQTGGKACPANRARPNAGSPAGTSNSSSFFNGNSKKGPVKRNSSILNFFQKSETPPVYTRTQHRITDYTVKRSSLEKSNGRGIDNTWGSLFFEDESSATDIQTTSKSDAEDPSRWRSVSPGSPWRVSTIDDSKAGVDEGRYNENSNSAQKRRKTDHTTFTGGLESPNSDRSRISRPPSNGPGNRRIGPFMDDSDSEDDSGLLRGNNNTTSFDQPPVGESKDVGDQSEREIRHSDISGNATPELGLLEDVQDPMADPLFSDGDDDLPNEVDEPFEFDDPIDSNTAVEGAQDAIGDPVSAEPTEGLDVTYIPSDDEDTPICPICRITLGEMTDTEASLHVNQCLDGEPTPAGPETKITSKSGAALKRLERAAIARPAQRNPFTLDSGQRQSSAFTKLMAGNAEDSAWSAAAAHEVATRGKQAYERTCPFYKILPGFSICVDAFRYGAVDGCNAYFLSHFHSDHYMGLTSSWCHGPIYCSKVTGNLVRQQLRVNPKFIVDLDFEEEYNVPNTDGVRVTMIQANHCPGSSLFLFEKTVGKGLNPKVHRILHCGDFRASPEQVRHPLLRPDPIDSKTGKPRQQMIDVCYLDTTYLNPKYAFPRQADVVTACADVCVSLDQGKDDVFGGEKKMAHFMSTGVAGVGTKPSTEVEGKLLVVIGTYSIGKERICVGIARALKSKIYAPAAKQKICSCLEDEELSSLLTSDPLDAQVHMQTLMEIRAETLTDYLSSFKPRFTRIAGFRPTGWNYRPPAGRMTDNPPVSTVLYSESWRPRFSARDLVPQRGNTKESSCFGVPYSEHSSFRELSMFCCALRIGRIIPTVNVGSKKSRERMKAWMDKWEAEKRKNGLFKVDSGAVNW